MRKYLSLALFPNKTLSRYHGKKKKKMRTFFCFKKFLQFSVKQIEVRTYDINSKVSQALLKCSGSCLGQTQFLVSFLCAFSRKSEQSHFFLRNPFQCLYAFFEPFHLFTRPNAEIVLWDCVFKSVFAHRASRNFAPVCNSATAMAC